MRTSTALSFGAGFLACLALAANRPTPTPAASTPVSDLGAFSSSLAVKDIAASRAFYETLGFSQAGGVEEQNWLVLRNGTVTIGLFQGMFPENIMTFNPGWGAQAKPIEPFEDIRSIQRRFKAAGLTLTTEADEDSTGVASFTMLDPDGNMLLFDQHVPKPAETREE